MLSKFNLVEIDSIENLENPTGIAYDLEVEEDHSYNVDGIIVHNSICSTRVQTGHGIPTLQSVLDCAASDRDAIMIADGGIKNSGDMVKALAAGADAVMCGSLLAGTKETPGVVLRTNDGSPPRKIYRGMASHEAQKAWRGKIGSIEGVSTTVTIKGSVAEVLHDLEWGIRSGLSYSGAYDLVELRTKARFVEQTQSGQAESSPHALSRI